jgi:ATP-binding cassette, subfamily C, bacterial LapB
MARCSSSSFPGWRPLSAGVYSIIAGSLSVGALVATYMLGSRVLAPLGQIAGLITRYQQAQLTMRSTDALMALPQERDPQQRPLERTQLSGALEVSQVTFRYAGQNTPALSQVSFQLKAGERVGIIGRSGSGKSTLGRLVMGFYAPEEGQLLLDGLDLRQLDVADLRQQVGYVAHDLPLLAGSLRDNLTLGARYISDVRMLQVAELTGVQRTGPPAPARLRTAGGRARPDCCLAASAKTSLLARALLLDPPILLLDEPTSAMDNSSEETLRQRLELWVKGKTLLLVTHRTSMLSLVDRLIVLDNGRIVADGPKESVIDALRKGRVGSAAV